MTKRGLLIVIDGIDGSGKATQAKKLRDRISAEGYDVETIDFPQYTNNFFGGLVRQYLDGRFGVATDVNPYLASVLYAADRWESSHKIWAWLDQGKIVILDRYMTSNIIHQGTKLKSDELQQYIQWLSTMEFDVFKIPKPDKVLFLHVTAEVSYDLIGKRGQGFDGHNTMQHLQAAERQALDICNTLGWHTIECCSPHGILPIDTIHEAIFASVKPMLHN